MKKLDELQRRLDKVEKRDRAEKPPHVRTARIYTAPVTVVTPGAPPPAVSVAVIQAQAPIPGLLPPEPMGSQFEDALRSDLPGLAIRIPWIATEVRTYGFAKTSGYTDFNGRNQTHTPSVSGIPLNGSAADQQGGDSNMTARFSRVGLDTRTLTSLGTLETRVEGDFAGGAAASSNLVFRLRQAWGELGTDAFRVLVGQANSLWNEGMYETLNDSTNLNQSFVRQAQIRFTGRLAPQWTGQLSVEQPETQFTSNAGVFTPDSSVFGGLSPAFSSIPDLLGRLNYRDNGLEWDTRALVRELSIRTAGTGLTTSDEKRNSLGWGIATHARFPMRWLSDSMGADQLIGMAFYGQGIGRYFGGNSPGQDLLTNVGLPGVGTDFDQQPLTTYGGTIAYRRFWLPQLRSNLAYSVTKQEYPAYAQAFTPGSAAAFSLNQQMQQGIVNLIWSPYGTVKDGRFDAGWLDAGIEYIYMRRDVLGNSVAGEPVRGEANRFMAAAIVRW